MTASAFLFLEFVALTGGIHACRPELIAAARADVLAGEFDAARARLGPATADYDCAMFAARIEAWSGHIDDARRRLDRIETTFGANRETRTLNAQLYYYEGAFDRARQEYEQLAHQYPDDEDIRTGLGKAEAAIGASSAGRRWRLDAGAEYSAIARATQPDWRMQYAVIGRRFENGPAQSAFGGYRHYRQFGRDDSEIEIGGGVRLPGEAQASLAFSVSPDASFRPDYAVTADFRTPLWREGGERNARLIAVMRYRFSSYHAGKVSTIASGLEAGAGPWRARARAITVIEHGRATLAGWSADGAFQFTDKIALKGGLASAPETIAGESVSTRSFHAGADTTLSDRVTLRLSALRENRRDDFVRIAGHAGIVLHY